MDLPTRTRTHRGRRVLTALASAPALAIPFALAAPAAHAQPGPAAPPAQAQPAEPAAADLHPVTPAPTELPKDPAALARLLEHPDYRLRQRAQLRLTAADLSDDQLRAMIDAAHSPEALLRLERIALHRFVRSRRDNDHLPNLPGALGVTFEITRAAGENAPTPAVVTILQTKPGFPGREHFLPDDQILAIDGQPLEPDLDTPRFRQRVESMMSGERHTFRVLRHNQELDVTLTIGAAVDLYNLFGQQRGNPMRASLQKDWQAVRQALFRDRSPDGATLEPQPAAPWPDAP